MSSERSPGPWRRHHDRRCCDGAGLAGALDADAYGNPTADSTIALVVSIVPKVGPTPVP